MAKVLLVEDDNNLREIYEARLQAEGYEISSAQDGEQALVVAKQFKPDLIISDVMMPKISGFEMLDILRNTEGLEHTRVIMLTALGQAEDKTRADSLGADRYLVKSQVTLEDIVKSAHEILDSDGADVAPAVTGAPATAVTTPGTSTPPAAPVEVMPAPEVVAAPAEAPTATAAAQTVAADPLPVAEPPVVAETPTAPSDTPVTADSSAVTAPTDITNPVVAEEPATSVVSPETTASAPANESVAFTDTAPAAPVSEPAVEPPVAAEPVTAPNADPAAPDSDAGTTASEQQTVNQQIEDFINNAPSPQPTEPAAPDPVAPAPETSIDDQLLAEAADSLSDAVDTETDATLPSATTEPSAAPAPAPVASEQTPSAQPAPENDGVTISGKKIIQPIGDAAKPDINELLAREEAKEAGLSPNPTATSSAAFDEPQLPPHQPGDAFAPQQPSEESPQQSKPDDFNPHDIAL